jgi:hypothetical protein
MTLGQKALSENSEHEKKNEEKILNFKKCWRAENKVDKMGGTCSTHGRYEKCIQNFCQKNLKEKNITQETEA